ncbi:hypothetical protein BJ925_0036 [Rahnella aquatilis]|nr:hypothetical protein BJ925_0036 [Rahnella aquatilis]
MSQFLTKSCTCNYVLTSGLKSFPEDQSGWLAQRSLPSPSKVTRNHTNQNIMLLAALKTVENIHIKGLNVFLICKIDNTYIYKYYYFGSI